MYLLLCFKTPTTVLAGRDYSRYIHQKGPGTTPGLAHKMIMHPGI